MVERVINGNKRINVFSRFRNIAGDYVILSLELSQDKRASGKFGKYNLIVTGFGHKINYLNNITNDPNNVIIYNKKTTQRKLMSGRKNVPNVVNAVSFNKSISTKSDPLFDEIVASLHINDDSPLIGTLQKFVGTSALQKVGIKIDRSVGDYSKGCKTSDEVNPSCFLINMVK